MVYIYLFLLTVAKIVESYSPGTIITELPSDGNLFDRSSNISDMRLESKTIIQNITMINNTVIGNTVKITFTGPDFGTWNISKNNFSSTAYETGNFITFKKLTNGLVTVADNKFNMSRLLTAFTHLHNTDLVIKNNMFFNALYHNKAKTFIHNNTFKSLILTGNDFRNQTVKLSDSVIHILVITNNTFNNSEFTCKNVAANYYYVTNNFTHSSNCFLRFKVDLETAMSMTPEFKWGDSPKKTCYEKAVPTKRPRRRTTTPTTTESTTETIPTTEVVTEISSTFQTRDFSTQSTSSTTTEKPDDNIEKKSEQIIISGMAFSNAIVIIISFAIFFELNVLIILVFIFRWRAKMFATQKTTEL